MSPYYPTCNLRFILVNGKSLLQQEWVSDNEGEDPEWRFLPTVQE